MTQSSLVDKSTGTVRQCFLEGWNSVHMGLAHMGPESPEVELQHAGMREISSNMSFINLVQYSELCTKVFYLTRFMHDILSVGKWL